MSMYTINPGDFKHKFEIHRLVESIDADNIPVNNWLPIWTAKGRVRNNVSNNRDIRVSVNGRDSSQGENSHITKIITARFPRHLNDFDVEDVNSYRVLYNNKLYKITSMSDIREEKKYIQINIGVWA